MPPVTDPIKAAQAMVLGEAGYDGQRIANIVGLPRRTVSEIISGHGHWGEMADKPVFASLRLEQNKILEATARMLAAKAFARAEQVVDNANFRDAVWGGAVLIDKARLLAGESTANIEVHTKHEVTGLDKLCDMLSQSLLTGHDKD